jgi:hypothetical protein
MDTQSIPNAPMQFTLKCLHAQPFFYYFSTRLTAQLPFCLPVCPLGV